MGAVPQVHGVVVMGELIRQRDAGSWTFVSCVAPDGRVQLLMRPHAMLPRERAHVYRLSPAEVRALVACLDILPDEATQ